MASQKADTSAARRGCVEPGAATCSQPMEPTPAPSSSPLYTQSPTTIPDWKAVGGGLVLFGAGYGLALAAVGSSRWMAIPLAGPWIALGTGAEKPSEWALALDGIMQGSGALITAGGFIYPTQMLGPAAGSHGGLEVSARPSRAGSEAVFFVVAPTGLSSLGVRATF